MPEHSLFYDVRSQSDPTVFYLVDVAAPLCPCPLFIKGGVDWCKHLAAARRIHNDGRIFDDSDRSGTLDLVYEAVERAPTTWISAEGDEGSLSEEDERSGAQVQDENEKDSWWDGVASKLRFLGTMPLLQPLTIGETEKGELMQLLDRLMDQILPKTATLPPKANRLTHMRASTETAQVLPKLKKKATRGQYGPYSMGEASGKKAKDKAPRSEASGPRASSTSLAGPIPQLETSTFPETTENITSWFVKSSLVSLPTDIALQGSWSPCKFQHDVQVASSHFLPHF
jgi:hypothetical protein